MKNLNILGIIPARGGSKGIPRKNIKILNGKPLIVHTIEQALLSNLNSVIVTTDDQEIINIAQKAGVDVPFVRPKELSNDFSLSIDVTIHALLKMQEIHNTKYDAIMLLQPTAPFRESIDINNCIDLLNSNNQVDSVISVVDVEAYHPARMKYIENGFLIDPLFCEKIENQNRQDLEPMYIRNGAIYLTRKNVLLNRSYKGDKSLAYVMPKNRSINIDTNFDFQLAEWLKRDII